MYICICKGITEKMLIDQLSSTNRNEEILKNLGIGDSCGICVIDCLEKIKETSGLCDSHTHHQDS